MRSISVVVASAVGAAIAVISLIGPTTFFVVDSISVGSGWGSLFDSSAAVTSIAVLVALMVAVFIRRTVAATGGAAVGLVALVVLAFTVSTSQGIGYPTAIAAGLVLGSLAVASHSGPSTDNRAGRIGLGAGVVGGFVLAQSLPSLFSNGPGVNGNRRYADYVPGDLVASQNGSGGIILVGTIVALIALAVHTFQTRGATTDLVDRPDATIVITGIGIAVAIGLVSAWLHESRSPSGDISPPGWVFGSLVIVIVLAVALVMPGRSGLAWVGVVALVATGAAADVSDVSGVIVIVVAVLIGLGSAAARRRNLLPVGIAVLVLVVLLQLMDGDSSELVAAAAALFVAPFAVSYTVAACVSEPQASLELAHPAVTATAVSACVPLSALRGTADFGWTAYTPLTDARSSHLDLGFQTAAGTTVATSAISLIVAGVVAWVITRRVTPRHEIGTR